MLRKSGYSSQESSGPTCSRFVWCVSAASRVPYFYQSGEQIKPGDRVRLHGEPGEVELVADSDEHEGGVMVVEPKVFGRLFIPAPVSHYEDLEFVTRTSELPE